MAPRILVTDAQERAVVATVRCLGAAGFAVTAVAGRRMAPGLWSRYPHQRHQVPEARLDLEGFLSALADIAARDPHDLLLAGTDASLLALSRHRDRLEPHVKLALPSEPAVELALDKQALGEAARAVGLDPPPSVVCHDLQAAVSAADRFGYPLLVKPISTVVEQGGQALRCASALIGDPVALERSLTTFGEGIVQQHAAGGVISVGGVMAGGGLLGYAVSRYLRTWPPRAGNASYSETIEPPAGLLERTQELVRRLGWAGVFELELIQRHDGSLAAIDFNPRVYGSLALAVSAGAPLPAVWCVTALGGIASPCCARVGHRYRWEDADLRALLSESRSRGWRMSGRRLSASLRGPPNSLGSPQVAHAYFARKDPGPAVARVIELLERSKRRLCDTQRATPARVQVLDSLEAAAGAWRALAASSGNIFSTWEWAETWYRHFGAGRRLTIALVNEPEVRAIVPLVRARGGPLGLMRFVGFGLADQLGPVCSPEFAGRALSSVLPLLKPGELLLGDRLGGDCDWRTGVGVHLVHEEANPSIDLTAAGSWQSYLATRSPNFRQQVRRRERRLSALGLRFRLADDPSTLGRDLDLFLELHAARWGSDSPAFRGARSSFHHDFAALALRQGWLRLWIAESGQAPVAAWYGLRFDGIEYYYQAGRDPAWDKHSVGAALLEHSIREAFADGMREYRLLRGSEHYKDRYATHDSGVFTVVTGRGRAAHSVGALLATLGRSARARRLLELEGPRG
ncbi:MAG: GNAT family N-acetyltransferase [Solirubrobacteraceae bacterium]